MLNHQLIKSNSNFCVLLGREKISHSSPLKGSGKVRKAVVKRPWTEEENAIIKECFSLYINSQQIPPKSVIEQCQQKFPSLQENRTWCNIKDKVRNSFAKNDL